MAQQNRREIELALEITTANAEALGKLREEVKELGKSGNDAAPAFKALGDEVGRLEQQAKALQTIDALSADLAEVKVRQEAATAAFRDATGVLDQYKAGVNEVKAAEAAKNLEIRAAIAAAQAASNELKHLRTTTDAAGKATLEYIDRVRELSAAEKAGRDAAAAGRVEREKLKIALRDANAELVAAGRAYRDAKTAADATTTSVTNLDKAIDRHNRSLVEAGGVSIKLGDAQQQLAADVMRVKTAITDQIAEVDRKARAERIAAEESERLARIQIATSKQLQAQARAEADGVIRDYERMEQAQREAGKAAQEAGKRIADAFGDTGQRSVQEIRAEIQRVRESMALLASSGAATGAELDAAMRRGEVRVNELEREIREATGALTLMDKAGSLLNTTLGQLAAFVSLVEIVQRAGMAFLTANANMERMRLGLASVFESAELAESQIRFLQQTADRAGVSFNGISDTFLKFSASTRLSNIPLEQTNELFAELTRVSGVLGLSADRVTRSLEAISQIAAKGVVNMEELRQQLGDNLPGALALTAEGLGVTTRELFKMVEQGQVLATDFVPALTRSLKGIQGESTTLTAEWQRLNNAMTRAFQNMGDAGVIDAIKVGLRGATDAVNMLANNMQTVVDTVTLLGKAWLAWKAIGLIQAFTSQANAVRAVAAEVVEQTAVLGVNTAATHANTAAKTANAAAGAAMAASMNAATLASMGQALQGVTVAAGEAARNKQAVASAAGVLGTVMGKVGGVVRGVTAFLGGPLGLVVTLALFHRELITAVQWVGTLVTDLGKLALGMETTRAAARKLADEQERLRILAEDQKKAAEAQAAAEEKLRIARLGLTSATLGTIKSFDELREAGTGVDEALQTIGRDFDLGTNMGIENAIRVLGALRDEGKITGEQMRAALTSALDGGSVAQFQAMFQAAMLSNVVEAQQFGEALKAAQAAGLDPAALNAFVAQYQSSLGITALAFREAATQWREAQAKGLGTEELAAYELRFNEALAAIQTRATEAMSSVKRDTQLASDVLEISLRAAIQNAGLDFEQISKGMGAAARTSIGELDLLIANLGELQVMGVDTATVLEASIARGLNTADSQLAIDEVSKRIEGLRHVLGERVTNGLLQQAEAQARELRSALDDTRGGINSVAEAMRALGVTTQASLDGAASRAREAFDVIRGSGQATTRELQQAFEAYARAAVAANGGVVDSTLRAQASALNLSVESDNTGRVIVNAMNQAAQATANVTGQTQRATQAYQGMAQSAQQAARAVTQAATRSTQAASGQGAAAPVGGTRRMGGGVPFTQSAFQVLRERAQNRTLTADDLELARGQVDTAQQNLWAAEAAGLIRMAADQRQIWEESRNIYRQIQAVVAEDAIRKQTEGALAASQAPPPTPVNININGASTRVNVASATDAQALQGVLNQLASQAQRATI